MDSNANGESGSLSNEHIAKDASELVRRFSREFPVASVSSSDPSAFEKIRIIGYCCGEVGTVLLSKHKPSTTLVAVRKYNLDLCPDDTAFIKEINLMKQMKHTNLLPLLSSFTTGPWLLLVTPLMEYGSVSDLLQSHFVTGLPEPAICIILRDVLQALSYLHAKGYIHRNVRASHILISARGQVCLSGLRDALHIVKEGRWQRAVHIFPPNTQRSLNWLSPEVIEQNLRGYNEKSDIYSLGITACEMANGIVPYADLPSTQLLLEKLQGPPPLLWDCTTVQIPLKDEDIGLAIPIMPSESGVFDNSLIESRMLYAQQQRSFSRSFHQMTLMCVQREQTLRPTVSQVLKHVFFYPLKKGQARLPDWLSPVAPILSTNCYSDSVSSEPANLLTDILAKLEVDDQEWDFTFD